MRLSQIRVRKIYSQAFGFFIAGILSNITSLTTYLVLYNFLNLSLFSSSIAGQTLGLICNYIINSRFVFMKRLKLKKKFLYIVYYLSAIYIVGIGIEYIENIGINYVISWFICVFLATIVNFIFVKYLAFRK